MAKFDLTRNERTIDRKEDQTDRQTDRPILLTSLIDTYYLTYLPRQPLEIIVRWRKKNLLEMTAVLASLSIYQRRDGLPLSFLARPTPPINVNITATARA